MSKRIPGGFSRGAVPNPGRKQASGGGAGRSPGKTWFSILRKTEESTPKRPRRGSGYSESPRSKRPRKGQKPNDGT